MTCRAARKMDVRPHLIDPPKDYEPKPCPRCGFPMMPPMRYERVGLTCFEYGYLPPMCLCGHQFGPGDVPEPERSGFGMFIALVIVMAVLGGVFVWSMIALLVGCGAPS
jgi:hypothetical protein